MSAPSLKIVKRMVVIHGKARPVIEVKAEIGAIERAFLLEHFANENLFKRTAYASGFSDGGLQASPPLSRMLNHFVKNDACPEVTVKTLTNGQKFEGSGLWDLQCFEFVAKRSFDALVELAEGVRSFDGANLYFGFGVTADMAAYAADTAAELATVTDINFQAEEPAVEALSNAA
jgi:hypothetical protein